MDIIEKLKIAQKEFKARLKDYDEGSENYAACAESVEKLQYLIDNPKLFGDLKTAEIIHFDNYEGEIWKPIPLIEQGFYEVSNKMRGKNLKSGKIIYPHIANGYNDMSFVINGKQKSIRMCKVVASAFVPNPDNKPFVDHINTNPLDDRPQNLRWVTQSENMSNVITRSKMTGSHGEAVLQYTKKGEFVKEYINAQQAVKENGWKHAIWLSACCRNGCKAKTYKGFIWKFKKDVPEEKMYAKLDDAELKYYNTDSSKCIVQFSLDGKFIHEWDNCKIAAKETGVDCTSIYTCCSGQRNDIGGYVWKYKDDVPQEQLEGAVESKDYRKISVSKAIIQYTLDGDFVKEWACVKDIADAFGCSATSIKRCCFGDCKQCRGYIWKFKEEQKVIEKNGNRRCVVQCSLDGKVIKEWDSITQASRALRINMATIIYCCRGKQHSCGGFLWKYK